jgi:4-hydroxythreonine-4-phosphate dehydrogenase
MTKPRIGLVLGDPCGIGPEIAMKRLGFDRGVTVLAGLPFPVTTPAHGTAFDIVGQGSANPEPISHAFDVALNLIGDRG